MQKSRTHTLAIFAFLLSLNLIIYYLVDSLLTEEILYQDMINHFDHGSTMDLIKKRNTLSSIILKYSLQGVWIVIKFFSIVILLLAGQYAFNIKSSLNEVFGLILLPYFIFLLPDLIKVIWFSFINTNYGLADLNNFPHFSLSDILLVLQVIADGDSDIFIKRLLTPINIFNLFFCYSVSRNITSIKEENKIVFKAIFISYFSVLIVLRLILLLFTSIITK